MHSFFALAQLALFALPILATPVTRTEGKTIGHIIKLKDGVDRAAHVQSLSLAKGSSIVYDYSIINGYYGKFSDAELDQFKAHNDVEYVEEDRIASISNSEDNNPWGLNRISTHYTLEGNDPSFLNFTYTYGGLGAGVDIYVIDTGININHTAFEGRATWGKTFGGYPDVDDNGHGTHCAGTAISYPYGVAQYAEAIAVKVLGADGSGETSDIVAGLQWIGDNIQSTGRLGLVSMSLGTTNGTSKPVDDAVRSLISSNITVVVAAGNSNQDTSLVSPADVQEAIVVGASNISDARAYFSNFGATVDLFAPGVGIISTWNDGSTKSLSGTSMACPHVAGQAAVYLSDHRGDTPADVETALTDLALYGELSDIPSGTANLLLNNGF